MFNLEFLAKLRAAELREIERALPAGARVLELGGGTGQQAMMLSERGVDIVSVDVEGSRYHNDRVFPVIDYDGRNLPFADAAFDVIVSSNVLEHVEYLGALHVECTRVLRPNGFAVHIMPTHSWRFWTSIAHYADLLERVARALPAMVPRSLTPSGLTIAPARGFLRILDMVFSGAMPTRHGERGSNLSEIAYFRPGWWRREFRANDFEIEDDHPMGLFYTGYMVLGERLSLDRRRRLSRLLGSACHFFRIRPIS